MQDEEKLKSGDVAWFRRSMTWRVLSSIIELWIEQDRERMENFGRPDKDKVPDAYLVGRISRAKDLLALPASLEKKLKIAEEAQDVVESQ